MPRIEVLSHEDDGRALQIEKALQAKGIKASVRVADVYASENSKAGESAFIESLTNPVTQKTGKLPRDLPPGQVPPDAGSTKSSAHRSRVSPQYSA